MLPTLSWHTYWINQLMFCISDFYIFWNPQKSVLWMLQNSVALYLLLLLVIEVPMIKSCFNKIWFGGICSLATCFVRKMLFLLRIPFPLEKRNDCLCQSVCCQLCIINHNAGPRILVFLMHFELESMVEKSCILKFKIYTDGACLAVFEKYNKIN